MKDISEEIAQMDSIKIGEHEFDIEFMLGADWKFLAMSVGIESATADYFCILCKCMANERYNKSKMWSISDTQKMLLVQNNYTSVNCVVNWDTMHATATTVHDSHNQNYYHNYNKCIQLIYINLVIILQKFDMILKLYTIVVMYHLHV